MKAYQIIKRYREEHMLSQDCVAYALGISQSQYSRKESGQSNFSFEEIVKISKLLMIETEVLVPGHTYNDDRLPHNGRLDSDLIRQYEARLQEKDEMIALLREKIRNMGGVVI